MVVTRFRYRVNLVVDLLLKPVRVGALEVKVVHGLTEPGRVRVPQLGNHVVHGHESGISVSDQVLKLLFHLVLLVVNGADFANVVFVQIVCFLQLLLELVAFLLFSLESALELSQALFTVVVLLFEKRKLHNFIKVSLQLVPFSFY